MKIKKTLFFLMLCLVALWIGNLAHEEVHKIAFDRDGIYSEVVYQNFFPTMVVAEQGCDSDECKIMNNMNEVVAYNQVTYIVLLISAFSIIIFILDNKLSHNVE